MATATTTEELADEIIPMPAAPAPVHRMSVEDNPIEPLSSRTQNGEGEVQISKAKAFSIIGSVAGTSFLNTMGSGILTVALPRMAKDLDLPPELLLWPASIYALTCGCTLLLFGSVADIIGRRKVYLLGCALFSIFTLACGLSRSAAQLIAFRALLGISISLCLTTAVGIISNTFPAGPQRNIAFASMGAGSPIGYSVGLVMGGVFVDSIGWRYGYYIAALLNSIVFAASWWGLPRDEVVREDVGKRLLVEIDWIGTFLASLSLGMLLTVLALITGTTAAIHEPPTIVLLILGVAFIPAFIFWVGRQERLGRPAIIPNSIWSQAAFTTICASTFLTWASFNSFGYFATLYLQEIEMLPALQTSLRFLPTVAAGFTTNIVISPLLRVLSASALIIASSLLSAVAGILMAVAQPSWPYWYAVFPAMFLSPLSSDVMFTISNIIVSNAFPPSKQSLAGGVFNTVSQIGNSVGLAVTAVIASTVTNSMPAEANELLKGYRASFWAILGTFVAVVGVSAVGMRKVGKVGIKAD